MNSILSQNKLFTCVNLVNPYILSLSRGWWLRVKSQTPRQFQHFLAVWLWKSDLTSLGLFLSSIKWEQWHDLPHWIVWKNWMNYYIKGLRTAQCSKTGERGGNCALYTLSYFSIFVPRTWIFHLTTKKQAIKNLPTLNIWKLGKTQVIEWMWKSPENERHLHRSRILELLGYIKIHKEMGLKHRLPGLTSRH